MLLLLAIGWVNPFMLGGLALIAAPIIIHLIARRRFQVVEWGAMRFLIEAERENRRRARFEEWLLLLLRCLAMALLALLFARPILDPGLMSRILGEGATGTRILLLDDSASMGYTTANQTEFEEAKRSAERLIRAAANQNDGRGLSIYLLSSPHAPLARYPRFQPANLDDAISKLQRIQRTALRGNPAQMMEAISGTDDALVATGQNDIHVFSDFQESDWMPDANPQRSIFASLHDRVTQLEESGGALRLFLYASGTQARPNVSIRVAETERPQVVAGFPVFVRADVNNRQVSALRETPLEVKIDGAVVPNVTIEQIAAGTSELIPVEVVFPEPGEHVLELICANHDQFSTDDIWRGVFTVRAAIQVLIVNGAPGDTALEDEAYLFANALAPPGPLSSGIEVKIIAPEELQNTPLLDFDVVMLCNLPPPEESVVRVLERYVADGGGLFVTLGDYAAPPETMNAALYRDGVGLLPLPMGETIIADARSEGFEIFSAIAEAWTAFLPADADASLGLVRVRAFVSTPDMTTEHHDVTRRGPTTILANYSDPQQSPAIASCTFGAGRVVEFTSSIDQDWNNWARTPDGSYVVMAIETMRYLARRDLLPTTIDAGEVPQFGLSLAEYESAVVFKPPGFPEVSPVDGEITRSQREAGDEFLVQGPAASHVGLLEIELNHRTRGQVKRTVAVNQHPLESALARVPRREFGAGLGSLEYRWIEPEAMGLESSSAQRREIWRWIVMTLIATLLLEQGLAWRFGGGKVSWRKISAWRAVRWRAPRSQESARA
ncbi:MAG: BatA domain-containing protein [Phycisphaerae bacterium]